MKRRSLSISVLSILLILSACTYDDLWWGETAPVSSIEYVMFGHISGFCMQCDVMYKIENRKLFGANRQMIPYPDSIQLQLLPDSSFRKVYALVFRIPRRIVTGSSTSVNNIGTSFPDAGHYYVEVGQSAKVYRWFIEPGNLPTDVQDFVTAVQAALGKLN